MKHNLSEIPHTDEELLVDEEEVNFDSEKEVPLPKKSSDKIGATGSKKRANSNDSRNR